MVTGQKHIADSKPAILLQLTRNRRTRAPALDWRAVFKTVEAHVRGGQHLCQHDDLSGVHRKVFGDVEDGFEDVDVVALDFAIVEDRCGVEGFECGFDFREC